MSIDIQQAHAFLKSYLGHEPAELAYLGAGAWSRCFEFRHNQADLVIRFGKYVDDFHKDQLAYAYAMPALPIPQVIDIGTAFDGYYAISTRAYGIPLENIAGDAWLAMIPALVSMLEALRLADITATSGFGGWGNDQQGPYRSWREYLLSTEQDSPQQRTHGWRARLSSVAEGEASFSWGLDMLRKVASDSSPRCLIHCDLMNKNVLVDNAAISAVFDWGCSLYGDHLYELAWFEFWAPWTPTLDIAALRSALEQHWQTIGYAPQNKAERLLACYLHIGLEHLAYNAYLGDWATLMETARRMRVLAAA